MASRSFIDGWRVSFAPLRSGRRSHSGRPGNVRRKTLDAGLGLLAAVIVGVAVTKDPFIAFGVVALVVAGWIMTRSSIAAIALGASLPAVQNLVGSRVGLNVAASDLLLVLVMARLLAEWAASKDGAVFAALRPVGFPAVQYCVYMVVLLVAHEGIHAVEKTGQRLELVAFPLIVGSFLAIRGVHIRLLQAYIVAATALAVIWPLNHLQLQKNPTGQMLANALLLVVAVPALRRLWLCAPILLFGLLATVSRGAVVAAVVGLGVIFLMTRGQDSRLPIGRIAALGLIALAFFLALPGTDQSRLLTFRGGTGTHAAYTIHIRNEFKAEARRVIQAHPWFGVGVGAYVGDRAANTTETDPHEVLYLEAAEGGYGFALSFIVLIFGTALALWRLAGIDLAPVATGILLGTAVHGLVDVYWVRGTPVLSWLLVGMVCGVAYQRRVEAAP